MSLDSTVHLDNPNTLKILIEQNRGVIAPIMIRKYTTWSNIWAAVDENGFYLRSGDYIDIINRDRLGVWNLPYISGAILINSTVLNKIKITYEHKYFDASITFAAQLREAVII